MCATTGGGGHPRSKFAREPVSKKNAVHVARTAKKMMAWDRRRGPRSSGARAPRRGTTMLWIVRRVFRALRAPLRRPLEPLLWVAATLSAKDVWVRPNVRARPPTSRRAPSRLHLEPLTANPPTPSPPPIPAGASLHLGPSRRPWATSPRARRRAPSHHRRAGAARRHALAGDPRLLRGGHVHRGGLRRSRRTPSTRHRVPRHRRRGRRRRRPLHRRGSLRPGLSHAQAHGTLPRRQDHARVDRPSASVLAPQDATQDGKAAPPRAPHDDGERLVPRGGGQPQTRRRRRRRRRRRLVRISFAIETVARGRGGEGDVRGVLRAPSRGRLPRDGETPGEVRRASSRGASSRRAAQGALDGTSSGDDAGGIVRIARMGGGLLPSRQDGGDGGRARRGSAPAPGRARRRPRGPRRGFPAGALQPLLHRRQGAKLGALAGARQLGPRRRRRRPPARRRVGALPGRIHRRFSRLRHAPRARAEELVAISTRTRALARVGPRARVGTRRRLQLGPGISVVSQGGPLAGVRHRPLLRRRGGGDARADGPEDHQRGVARSVDVAAGTRVRRGGDAVSVARVRGAGVHVGSRHLLRHQRGDVQSALRRHRAESRGRRRGRVRGRERVHRPGRARGRRGRRGGDERGGGGGFRDGGERGRGRRRRRTARPDDGFDRRRRTRRFRSNGRRRRRRRRWWGRRR